MVANDDEEKKDETEISAGEAFSVTVPPNSSRAGTESAYCAELNNSQTAVFADKKTEFESPNNTTSSSIEVEQEQAHHHHHHSIQATTSSNTNNESSSCRTKDLRRQEEEEQIHHQLHHKPPMSVIVFQDPRMNGGVTNKKNSPSTRTRTQRQLQLAAYRQPPTTLGLKTFGTAATAPASGIRSNLPAALFPSAPQPAPPSPRTTTTEAAARPPPALSSFPFKLQPRNPICSGGINLSFSGISARPIPATNHQQNQSSSRGRKRPAHSMSLTPPRQQKGGNSSASGGEGEDSSASQPSVSTTTTSQSAMNSLSATVPASITSSPGVSSALQMQGLSLNSPCSSQNSSSFAAAGPLRSSSFSKYNANNNCSGGVSASSVTAATTRCSTNNASSATSCCYSPSGGSCGGTSMLSSSSARIASVKVLSNKSDGNSQHHQRPPLPNTAFQMHSLDPSSSSAVAAATTASVPRSMVGSPPERLPGLEDDDIKEPPCRTVHCNPSQVFASPLRMQTHNHHHHHYSQAPASNGRRNIQVPSLPAIGGPLSPGSMSGVSRHTRTGSFNSAASPMRSVASSSGGSNHSPTSTPLPRINLTPRSSGGSSIRSRRGNELPGFPSPLDMTTSTPPTAHTSRSREGSFIPFPDWGDTSATPMPQPPRDLPSSTATHQGFYPPQRPTSLLAPPSADDALERYLGVTANDDNDNDSLSASDLDDDDETFFLAPPSVIQQERRASAGGNGNKQRKLSRSSMASNTSLRGMDFVTSSANLSGMERDSSTSRLQPNGSSTSTASFQRCLSGNLSVGDIRRQESQASIGLALEAAASTTNASTEAQKQGQEEEGRDLVTPPAMAQPLTPPPLSPRYGSGTENHDDDRPPAAAGNNILFPPPPRDRDIHYHSGRSPAPAPWFSCGEESAITMDDLRTRHFLVSTAPSAPPPPNVSSATAAATTAAERSPPLLSFH